MRAFIKYFIIFYFVSINTAYAHVLSEQSGWLHPLTGMDHVLAMIAVGAWSAIIGGRAVWIVPSFFLVFMFIGGLIGLTQADLMYTEQGIALSVLLLGIAIAVKGKIPTVLASVCTALFGVCHGYAHGYEIPVIDDATFYVAGFLVTTAFLHIVGLVCAHYLLKYKWGESTLRVLGLFCAISGMFLLVRL